MSRLIPENQHTSAGWHSPQYQRARGGAMSKSSNAEILIGLDDKVEKLSSEFHIDIERFLLEMMPEVDRGDYYDSNDLQSVILEDVLNNDRERTEIEKRLWDAALSLCKEFMVPEVICAPLVMMTILSLSKGNINEGKALISVLFSYSAYRSSFESAPSKLGAMGGRPSHPRKQEAMGLARKRWEQIPYANLNSVATFVKSKLEAKYTDAPKLPSIKSWLKEADFRP